MTCVLALDGTDWRHVSLDVPRRSWHSASSVVRLKNYPQQVPIGVFRLPALGVVRRPTQKLSATGTDWSLPIGCGGRLWIVNLHSMVPIGVTYPSTYRAAAGTRRRPTRSLTRRGPTQTAGAAERGRTIPITNSRTSTRLARSVSVVRHWNRLASSDKKDGGETLKKVDLAR
jgi:hypothetical protein